MPHHRAPVEDYSDDEDQDYTEEEESDNEPSIPNYA